MVGTVVWLFYISISKDNFIR